MIPDVNPVVVIEAKPILLVEIDNRDLNSQRLDDIRELLDKKFYDYHVLTIPIRMDRSESLVKLQAFYPKDFGKIGLQELKKQIEDTIKDNNKERKEPSY